MAIENPLESLSMTIPFSVRDWGQEKRDAWVYGIVCGRSDDRRAEFERKFGWDEETFDRLKRLHARFEEMRCSKAELAALKEAHLLTLAVMEDRLAVLEAERDGDASETYTVGYRRGHRNGQIELLRNLLGKAAAVTAAPEGQKRRHLAPEERGI